MDGPGQSGQTSSISARDNEVTDMPLPSRDVVGSWRMLESGRVGSSVLWFCCCRYRLEPEVMAELFCKCSKNNLDEVVLSLHPRHKRVTSWLSGKESAVVTLMESLGAGRSIRTLSMRRKLPLAHTLATTRLYVYKKICSNATISLALRSSGLPK